MITDAQIRLDVDAETLSSREEKLVQRLKEYRTIERDIREQEKIISGELTRCLPSMSPAGPAEDDITVLTTLQTESLSEGFQYIAQAVGKRVDMSKDLYANRQRVAKRLSNIQLEDETEDQALQDAYMILTERQDEDYLKLTQAERYASDREKEVAEAQEELNILVHRRNSIKHALDDLERYEPEWYEFLWSRYVMGEKYDVWVNRLMSEQRYRTVRKNALKTFGEWAVGLC